MPSVCRRPDGEVVSRLPDRVLRCVGSKGRTPAISSSGLETPRVQMESVFFWQRGGLKAFLRSNVSLTGSSCSGLSSVEQSSL